MIPVNKFKVHHASHTLIDYSAELITYNEGKNCLLATYDDLTELDEALFWHTGDMDININDFILKVEGNEVKLVDSDGKVVHNDFKLTITK